MLVPDAPRDRRIALRINTKRLRIRVGVEALMPVTGERRRIERRRVTAERLRERRRDQVLTLRKRWRDCCKRQREAEKGRPSGPFG
jgi:hypothetical protein